MKINVNRRALIGRLERALVKKIINSGSTGAAAPRPAPTMSSTTGGI